MRGRVTGNRCCWPVSATERCNKGIGRNAVLCWEHWKRLPPPLRAAWDIATPLGTERKVLLENIMAYADRKQAAMKAAADSPLRKELAAVLNRYSRENGSDTPDYVLADYLLRCLDAFDLAVQERNRHLAEPEGLIQTG